MSSLSVYYSSNHVFLFLPDWLDNVKGVLECSYGPTIQEIVTFIKVSYHFKYFFLEMSFLDIALTLV